MQKRFAIGKKAKDWLIMLAGTFLSAAGTSMFFTPCKIVDGGITSVSTIFFHLWGLPIGVTYALINAFLLILGLRVLGRDFVIKTVIGAGIMSLFMDALSLIPQITEDAMLATLFGSILYGTGRALNFIAGASSGGLDILGRVIQHQFPSWSIGKIVLPFDAMIIVASALVFRQADLVLLGIVGAFIQTIVIDYLIDRLNVSQVACIITEKGEAVTRLAVEKLHRKVTVSDAEGGEAGQHKQIILCAMKAPESEELHKCIKDEDPDAFVIFTEAKSVIGNGFRIYK